MSKREVAMRAIAQELIAVLDAEIHTLKHWDAHDNDPDVVPLCRTVYKALTLHENRLMDSLRMAWEQDNELIERDRT